MSDLSLNPDSVYEEHIEFKTLVSEFENGTEQRRAVWGTPRRKFVLVYENRPISEYTTISAFFIAKKGRLTAFTFTNINDSTEYTVRFDSDVQPFGRVAYDVINFRFTLVEDK